jgi:hypothetical protein
VDLEPLRTKLIADTNQFTPQIQKARDEFGRFIKTTDSATQSMQRHTRGMEAAAKALRDAQKQAKDHVHSINDISRALNAQRNIYHTLKGAVVEAYEAAAEGAKIMAAEQFFRNAGKSIGEYRKATNGMVSDAELMKKANLADSMGIDEATFKKLVMVAEASALKTGQSFDYMFNSIIVGTARSSRLLLDNLGIIVSVGQANETYAEKVNKTVEALSAEEKQLAFIEEVARQSQGTLDEYAQATDRTAESFARFDATIANVVDGIKVGLAQAMAQVLPSFTDFFKNVSTFIQSQDWGALGKYIGLKLVSGLATTLGAGLGALKFWSSNPSSGFANQIAKDADTAATAVLLGTENAQGNKKTELEDQLQTLLRAARPNMGGMAMADREEKLQFFANFSKKQIAQLQEMDPHWAGLISQIQETARALGILPKAAEAIAAVIPRPTGGLGGGSSIDKPDLHSAEAAFDKWLTDILEKDFVAAGRNLAAVFTSELSDAFSYSGAELKRQRKRLVEIQELLDAMSLERAQEVAGRVQGATEAIAGGQGLFGPIMSAMAPALGSSITAALSAAGMGTAAAGPLGGVLAGLAVVVVGLIDKLKPVTNLLGAVVDGLSLLIQHGLGDLLATLEPLSPALRELLAAVGILVGSALRPFISMMAIGVGIVTAVVQAVSFLLVVLSPFVEAIITVVGIFVTFGTALLGLVGGIEGVMGTVRSTLAVWGATVLGAAIAFNNAVVGIAKGFGLKGFGEYLSYDDFRMDDDESTEDNTEAIEANTRALRDFAREFRNLPANYKVGAAVYASEMPAGRLTGGGTARLGYEIPAMANNLRDRL